MKIKTGYLPFHGYRTYYRIVGTRQSDKAPLVLLHGGPGSTHNYFEVLDELAQTGHQLIMYDQLGCGQSSMPNDPTLWHPQTWVEELINLRQWLALDQIHLLGQSWGGMLAIIYLCDYHPIGIKSLILASTLSSSKLWAQEQHRLIKFMNYQDQLAITQAEQTGNYQATNYLLANQHFMQLYATDEKSQQQFAVLQHPKNQGTQAYETAWGPNEYTPTGNLKNYDYTKKLTAIKVPTLITSGTNDLCTPLVAKTMFDYLPNATWKLFAHSRHMAFIDEHQQYLTVLKQWLQLHN
ncbi:MAG: proline iminopeptidase-family hydrolase [Lactobacillus sp.]|uniref:proline iminopeptidase n=1 Tax=Bombilactobacillus bombi TaxID=1303590 RepID=UPI0035E778FB|nr:proline iminopeptidase-family hydrolase [Lactobacillus sp.]